VTPVETAADQIIAALRLGGLAKEIED